MSENNCSGCCGPTAEELRVIYEQRIAPRYLIQELTDSDKFNLEDSSGSILLERPPPLGLWIELDPVGDPSIWVEQPGPQPGERGPGIPASSINRINLPPLPE